MAEFDLNGLPDLVLIKLFKVLPVSDRGRLASCNWRLAKLMHTPELWRVINVEFDLHEELVCHAVPSFPSESKVVGKLRARDLSMIEKYGQHVRNVKVVMQSSRIESQSLAVLTELAQRQDVIMSVSLRLDRLLTKVIKWQAENPSVQSCLLWKTFVDNMLISSPWNEPRIMHPPASRLIDSLRPDADLTIALPPQSHNIQECFEHQFDFYLNIQNYSMALYRSHKSEKLCSVLKKLILSPLAFPEEGIARLLSQLSRGAQLPLPPTAQLISSFPHLEELHVNIVSLSDQLLLELSRASGGRKPLRSLVIRHLVCGCEAESTRHPHLFFFRPWTIDRFPQLSSAAWGQLAQSCPSLTVECSVVSTWLPQLLEVIKPETPLVRLEVLYHTVLWEDQGVLVLQELSENHSGLTIVVHNTCTDAAS